MITIYLVWETVKYMAGLFWPFVYLILTLFFDFVFLFPYRKEQIVFMKIYKDKFINTLSAKSTSVNERLKRIYEAFHVEIYFKLKPIECKITYLLYIF